MDLHSTTHAVLTPDSPVAAIPTGVSGPLPEGTVGLILGRSSTSLQGILVIPGVVDADYTGEIQILLSPPTTTIQIQPNQRIAQLILLPIHKIGTAVTQEARGAGGFGSSDAAFWIQEIHATRPTKILQIQGKPIEGLLDTGADVSCIAEKDWPSSWPTHTTSTSLVGLGKASNVKKSSQILTWADEDQHSGTFCPYVITTIPFTLWGRDILSQMGVVLYSPSDRVTSQMLDMRFNPGKGLGKESNTSHSSTGSVIGAIALRTADPIVWKSSQPVWVEQWPLTSEKISAARQLIDQQLAEGHIEPSNSPWNTPIFVIRKKSGKWRLLQDLRAINATMEDMGSLQPGLPSPVAIPQEYCVVVIDLQDCFFTIPLHPADCQRFAFSIPSENFKQP